MINNEVDPDDHVYKGGGRVEVEVSDIAFESQGRVYHAILPTLLILYPNNNIQITTCLKSKRWSTVCSRVI
jgi:hypothetical protein